VSILVLPKQRYSSSCVLLCRCMIWSDAFWICHTHPALQIGSPDMQSELALYRRYSPQCPSLVDYVSCFSAEIFAPSSQLESWSGTSRRNWKTARIPQLVFMRASIHPSFPSILTALLPTFHHLWMLFRLSRLLCDDLPLTHPTLTQFISNSTTPFPSGLFRPDHSHPPSTRPVPP